MSGFNPNKTSQTLKKNTILWLRSNIKKNIQDSDYDPFSKETKGKHQEFLNYFSIGTGFICKPIGDSSIKLARKKNQLMVFK